MDSNELHVGCESGRVYSGDLFLKGASCSAANATAMPHRFAVLSMAMQRSAPGQTGSILVAGAPCGLAVVSTFAQLVAGHVSEGAAAGRPRSRSDGAGR